MVYYFLLGSIKQYYQDFAFYFRLLWKKPLVKPLTKKKCQVWEASKAMPFMGKLFLVLCICLWATATATTNAFELFGLNLIPLRFKKMHHVTYLCTDLISHIQICHTVFDKKPGSKLIVPVTGLVPVIPLWYALVYGLMASVCPVMHEL